MPPRLDERLRTLNNTNVDQQQLDNLQLEANLTTNNTQDIEQVVDEPRELQHLTIDHIGRPDNARLKNHLITKNLHDVLHQHKQIAQLMHQHRQKPTPPLVLHRQHLAPLLLAQVDKNKAQHL